MTVLPPPVLPPWITPIATLIKQGWNTLVGLFGKGEDLFGSIGNFISENAQGLGDVLSPEKIKNALSPEAIKLALSYEECTKATLGFEELVKLIKQKYTIKPGIRICVLKKEAQGELDVSTLDVVALNDQDEPEFSAFSPWCHIIVAKFDEELINKFNGKSMLVLK